MIDTQNVLVTGGAGFIGSHVVAAFLARGASVTVIDDLSSGKRTNLPESVRFVHTDVRSPDAAAVVREGRFDAVCHLAAQIDVRTSLENPRLDLDVNAGGTVNVLEAIRASGKTSTRFVLSSTAATYGDVPVIPTPETAPKEPLSPYGIAKFGAEFYLAYYARIYGIPTVALRYANVYGPRQDCHGEAGVVAVFCERLLAGRPLTIFGDGLQTRDFVHAADVADANVRAATKELPPVELVDSRAFNISTVVETDVITLAQTLNQIAGGTASIQYAPGRPGEIRRSALANDKAKRLLGWTPRVTLQAGLADTFRWFAEQDAHVRETHPRPARAASSTVPVP
jgi:UDP-glucose 4-epimerase